MPGHGARALSYGNVGDFRGVVSPETVSLCRKRAARRLNELNRCVFFVVGSETPGGGVKNNMVVQESRKETGLAGG